MKKHIAPFLPSPIRSRLIPEWTPPPVVPVVRLAGTIGPTQPLRGGLNLATVATALDAAFSVRGAKAVAIIVNSPGGSPVQSSLIYKRIRALSKEKDIPVYAFAEDVAASGGYMIACAADVIYADESSVIGSIGVVSAGFGFTGLIEKLGIERRVHTAGENKAMLDPFQPENPEDVRRLKALQLEVHENFKALVREARGDRLKEGDPALFSGEFWAAKGALERGLIDGIADLRGKMRELFGDDVKLKPVSQRGPWWRPGGGAVAGRIAGLPGQDGAAHMGASLGAGLLVAARDRSLWGRFGL